MKETVTQRDKQERPLNALRPVRGLKQEGVCSLICASLFGSCYIASSIPANMGCAASQEPYVANMSYGAKNEVDEQLAKMQEEERTHYKVSFFVCYRLPYLYRK